MNTGGNRKELNIFSMSFLDMLSGALASVMILFIVVPKSDVQSQVADESMTKLKSEYITMDSIMNQLGKHMTPDEFSVIVAQSQEMKSTISKLDDATETLRGRLSETKKQNEILQAKLNQTESRLRMAVTKKDPAKKAENAAAPAKKSVASVADPKANITPESGPKTQVSGRGDFLFGLNPPFVVMIQWEDVNATVDLYLKNGNHFCDQFNNSTAFGKWVRFPKKLITTPNQAITQKELKPGIYEVYAHLYRPKNSKTKIKGFAAINPEKGNPKKIDFGELEIASSAPPYKSGGGTLIGTIEITENNITFKKGN